MGIPPVHIDTKGECTTVLTQRVALIVRIAAAVCHKVCHKMAIYATEMHGALIVRIDATVCVDVLVDKYLLCMFAIVTVKPQNPVNRIDDMYIQCYLIRRQSCHSAIVFV